MFWRNKKNDKEDIQKLKNEISDLHTAIFYLKAEKEHLEQYKREYMTLATKHKILNDVMEALGKCVNINLSVDNRLHETVDEMMDKDEENKNVLLEKKE